MTLETVAHLVLAGDHPDRTALVAPGEGRPRGGDAGNTADDPAASSGPDREYDYRRLRTDAQKTGNFLRHLGVAAGRTVAIAPERAPEPVLAALGTALLEGIVRMAPPGPVDARAAVAPTDRVGEYDLPAGGRRAGYGARPSDPGIDGFEKGIWSENPTFPPPSVVPDDDLLAVDDRAITHGRVLRCARGVASRLDADDTVALRADLADPRSLVAGVVAPLLAGATVLLPPGGDRTVTGSVAVATGSAPEKRVIDPAGIDLEAE